MTIAEISNLPYEKRIPALMGCGLITHVILGKFADAVRPIVVMNVNGIKQPFYRSAHGTSGKEKGAWHSFFGFGKNRHNGLWMIKGHLEDLDNHYNCKAISDCTMILNNVLNWPHELDLTGNNKYFNSHINWEGDSGSFNTLVFGTPDLNVKRGEDEAYDHIDIQLQKLNSATRKN